MLIDVSEAHEWWPILWWLGSSPISIVIAINRWTIFFLQKTFIAYHLALNSKSNLVFNASISVNFEYIYFICWHLAIDRNDT